MATGRQVAQAIADAIGGEVRELPTDGLPEFLVVVPTGRVPATARDFANGSVGACVPRGVVVVEKPTTVDAKLPELIESARDWLARRDPEVVSMYGLAIELLEILHASSGERWTTSSPGIAEPTELWLHPPQFPAGSVGVFPTRVMVRIGMTERTFPMTTLAELADATPRILAAIREQRAAFDRNAITSDQISATAERLAARLREADIAVKLLLGGATLPAGTLRATLRCGNRDIVIDTVDDAAVVQIGPRGRDFTCALAEADTRFDDLVAALAASRKRLTLADLSAGKTYRVLDGFRGTAPGDTVTFVGFDDLDNHYGEYVFQTSTGERIAVGGDYCYPDNTELGETHRYLEPIE